ncbi:MAG: GntR family transcriptional regulator [Eubacteriales bacterium]|nr:GntR family transcriptional regulator [Eubacteriales bacterium]
MGIEYFKNTFQFSETSDVPLYIQLAAYFRIQIQNGILKPGDMMIAENSLCELLNVSRTTVRQSMNLLVEEGLLIRYRGKGTFVANFKIKRNMNHLYSFTEDMQAIGAKPVSKVIRAEVLETCPDEIADILKLPSTHTPLFYLERLRLANDEPILWERTYIPYYLCNKIETFDFNRDSLYQVLNETYHLDMYHAKETLDAILLSKNEAALLECTSAKNVGYRIARISYLDSGFIFEYTTSVTRANKCTYQFDLYKNTASKKTPLEIKRNLSI